MSGMVSKVLKMLVFSPVFGFFLGWLIVVHFGFERFRCFLFLCLFLFFLCCFCFCFVCFVLGFVVGCCCFVFLFFCCFFVFLEGLKGQVRWPKGPPHLALNLLIFCLSFFFVFFGFVFFFVFWRV